MLVDDLTPRTIDNVHIRLVNALARDCPDVWQKHLDEFVGKHRQQTKPAPRPSPFRY